MLNKIKNSPRVILLVRNTANLFYLIQDYLLYFACFFNKSNNAKDIDCIVVTAADTSHFKSAIQLISSIKKNDKNQKIIFYDLGLTENEINTIRSMENLEIKYKKFEFENYPIFFRLSEKDAGAYAWKPQIIFDESKLADGMLLWMDAGDFVTKPLIMLKKIISNYGFYSPLSNGYLKQWTSKKTLDALDVKNSLYRKRMLNAAIVGINTKNLKYMNLFEEWKNLSYNKNIILPEGAGKNNHRWDQSILTILFYQKIKKLFFPRTHKLFGVLTHQDID